MKKFNDWYKSINEEIAEPTTVSEPTGVDTNKTTTSRVEIIDDVDSIMTSLETLSNELKESLEINEDGLAVKGAAVAGVAALAGLGVGAKKLYDASVKAPKAKKAQAKVNTMSLKIAGLEQALDNSDSEKKDKIKDKIKAMKSKVDEVQGSVDDKYGSASGIVKKALNSEKKRGKIEVLNIKIDGSSPEQQKKIKDQLIKLKSQVQADEAAFQKEVNDAKDSASEEDKNKLAKLRKDNKDKKSTQEKNSKSNKLTRLNELMKKAKAASDKIKVKKVQDLIDTVSAKESWQLNNTHLGQILESEITTLEMSFKLNESRYQNLSIKDKFNQLL